MGALLGGLLGKLIRSEAGFVLLVFLAWGHWSVYPDSGLFVKEVIQEVANQTSVCAAAYLLGVISLNDLASLEYESNRIEAAGSIRRLLDHLKDWMAIE